MKKALLALGITSFLTACASQPDKINTAYVSDIQYRNYDCDQLTEESSRISYRVNELYGNLKNKADADTAQMGIGLVLFWPTLFLLEGGDGPEAQEYARLKGEQEAIQKVAIQKKCSIDFTPLDPKSAQAKKEDVTGTATN
ncbi:MAG: hypothetical protein ACNI26_04220 [Terasakiella sp.]|uniref:hypothetical protein n=1 Tax=unclassified Terasakiella TaxID=2614952 RepID=UPI003AFF8A4F